MKYKGLPSTSRVPDLVLGTESTPEKSQGPQRGTDVLMNSKN